MLGINQAGFSLPKNNTKNNHQTLPQFKLKTLNKDAFVSFSGEGTKFVEEKAYSSVCKYIKDHPGTDASDFLKHIKELCETGGNSVLQLDLVSSVEDVEPERVKKVSDLLMSVKDSTKPTFKEKGIKGWMDILNGKLPK